MAGWGATTFGATYDWSKTANIAPFWGSAREILLITGQPDWIGVLPVNYDDISKGGLLAPFTVVGFSQKVFPIGHLQLTVENTSGFFVKPGATFAGINGLSGLLPIWQLYHNDESTYGPCLLKFAGCGFDLSSGGTLRGWTRKRPARITTLVTAGAASNFDDICNNPAFTTPSLTQVAYCDDDGQKYKLTNVAGTNTWVLCADQSIAVTEITGTGINVPMDYIGGWIWQELYTSMNALKDTHGISYDYRNPTSQHGDGASTLTLAAAKAAAQADWDSRGPVTSGLDFFGGYSQCNSELFDRSGNYSATIRRAWIDAKLAPNYTVTGASVSSVDVYGYSHAYYGLPYSPYGYSTLGDTIPTQTVLSLIASVADGGTYSLTDSTSSGAYPAWPTALAPGYTDYYQGGYGLPGAETAVSHWTRTYS